jgi:hypothetical protein
MIRVFKNVFSMNLAKIPPWTEGCSVLTLPPKISGAPEISETSLTARPASLRLLAVPPLATRVNPNAFKFLPNATRPVLLDTDNNARIIFLMKYKIYMCVSYRLYTTFSFSPKLPPVAMTQLCENASVLHWGLKSTINLF